MLATFALLAPFAVLMSEMPKPTAWPLAVGACAFASWRTRREVRRSPRHIVIASDGAVTVGGETVTAFNVAWRGPCAFLRWRDARGRVQRCGFWPDTLPAELRRELRLAAPIDRPDSDSSGMAH